MKPELAVDDKHTPFSHVAFTWEPDPGMWEFLCAGRTLDEFEHRVAYWISRGTDPDRIRKYVCTPPPAVTEALQAIEGESWGAWVGRLRAAQRPVSPATVAGQGGNPTPATLLPQPQPISEELWAVIKARRPGAYATLQRHGVCRVIMTVGTSRTKLEFPTCTYMSPGIPGWSEFDRDPMNPDRPIIVLDGIPANRFRLVTGIAVRD